MTVQVPRAPPQSWSECPHLQHCAVRPCRSPQWRFSIISKWVGRWKNFGFGYKESRSPRQLSRSHNLSISTQLREILLWQWMNKCKHQLKAGHYAIPFHHFYHSFKTQVGSYNFNGRRCKLLSMKHIELQSCPNVLPNPDSLTLISRHIKRWRAVEPRRAFGTPVAFCIAFHLLPLP